MTIGGSRRLLLVIWLVGTLPLFVLVFALSMSERFGSELDTPWNWFGPMVLPVLGLLFMSVTIDDQERHARPLKHKTVLFATCLISIVFLLLLYGVILMQPLLDMPISKAMRFSGLYLGAMQGLVTGLLGKFFVEN